MALVFSNHIPAVQPRLPKYLDLGYYYAKDKIPFTFSYNLLFALHEELKRTGLEDRFQKTARICSEFSGSLKQDAISVLGRTQDRVNFIFTLVFKNPGESIRFGDFCAQHHIGVHYKNDYLKARNWVQIVFMGHHSLKDTRQLFAVLALWRKNQQNLVHYAKEETLSKEYILSK